MLAGVGPTSYLSRILDLNGARAMHACGCTECVRVGREGREMEERLKVDMGLGVNIIPFEMNRGG